MCYLDENLSHILISTKRLLTEPEAGAWFGSHQGTPHPHSAYHAPPNTRFRGQSWQRQRQHGFRSWASLPLPSFLRSTSSSLVALISSLLSEQWRSTLVSTLSERRKVLHTAPLIPEAAVRSLEAKLASTVTIFGKNPPLGGNQHSHTQCPYTWPSLDNPPVLATTGSSALPGGCVP